MADDTLRSLRFRTEREGSWRRLEALLAKVEKRSGASLSDEEMLAIPSLYRAALTSLSVARATSLDQALIAYLEALSARAYFFIYGARTTLGERVGRFFLHDWPDAVRRLWRETLFAALIVLTGAVAAFAMVSAEPDWFNAFIPGSLVQGRDFNAPASVLRATLYQNVDANSALNLFATFLFTHNAQIALFCFALGFACCVPTVMLLAYNGCMLGAMVALFASRGLSFEFAGWALVHGVTEIFAIILAGAAGLRIGWSIAFPGRLSRLAAAEQTGRQGGIVIVGVVLMLFIAGFLEGVVRQVVNVDLQRWAIAAATAAMWALFFYIRPRMGNSWPKPHRP